MEVVFTFDEEEIEEILKQIREPLCEMIIERLKSSEIPQKAIKDFFGDLLNADSVVDYIDWEREKIGNEVTKIIVERIKTKK